MTVIGSATGVESVYVMFKCHLDVGFTDTEENVLRTYFEHHIPAAITTADQLRRRGGEERLVWTMPAWLLYSYLEQADSSRRAEAERAIADGALVWHALPFTWFTELLDRSSVEAALGFCRRLDDRFDRRTTAARLTDVPGHTRGLVGVLADAGVTFLDIGCNPGCQAPAVPHFGPDQLLTASDVDVPDPDTARAYADEPVFVDRGVSADEVTRLSTEGANEPATHLFNWRDPEGREIAVLYHPRAYGGTLLLPGTSVALSMRVHGDNHGPQSLASVDLAFASLRRKFPAARIVATDLSTIASVIEPLRPSLPVVTEEIGDTWIYGAGSDPARTAGLRELLRLRSNWVESGTLVSGGEEDLRLLGELVVAPEHNWGLNTSVYLREWNSYTPEQLAVARRSDPQFQAVDAEWAAQRDRPRRAAGRLPDGLRDEAMAALSTLTPSRPDLSGLHRQEEVVLHNETMEVRLGVTGAGLLGVVDRRTGREWARPHGLALFSYQTFDAADFARYNAAYNSAAFADNDFGKPGLSRQDASSATLSPPGADLWCDVRGTRAVLRLHVPSTSGPTASLAGWPGEVWLEVAPSEDAVALRLLALGKPASRLPEAMWLSFGIAARPQGRWSFDKLGQDVDPHDVIAKGGQHLHGVGKGVRYQDADGVLDLETLDAPLVAPGRPALLEFDDEPLDMTGGVHVNLYNNLWGTAFPQWYDEDMQFRFVLRSGEASPKGSA